MDADRQVDLSSEYLSKTRDRGMSNDAASFSTWLDRANAGDAPAPAVAPSPAVPPDAPVRPLPVAPPLRAQTDDVLGRPSTPEKSSSAVSRNLAEVPGAAVSGVESAIKNAMGWAINPLADWLNQNVADLSYTREAPKTPTGEITKSVSEFLTGFVPALKGLRAIGMGGNVAAPMIAGALADFAARDPSSGRLADMWKKLGLPENALTEFMSSKPEDTEADSRFKNALEGVGLGFLTEGVFLAARTIRAARNVRGAKQTEQRYLEDKYGTISDEEFNKVIGDPSKPAIEMKVSQPPASGKKLQQGLEDTKDLAPRSVIRMKAGKKAAGQTAGQITGEGDPKIDQMLAWMDDEKISVERLRKYEDGKYTPRDPERAARFEHLSGWMAENDLDIAKVEAYAKPKPSASIQPQDFEVYVNFAKFDEPDQVKFAIGKMAEAAKGTIDEATRGVITHEETSKLADELGMTVTDLLERRKGEPFNAEQAVAARRLWAASGERLLELAKIAAGKNAGPVDMYAFRKQMAVHSAIQSEVIGARTETARALSSWNIPVKGGIERARAIDQVMNAMGGQETAQEMARRIAILAEVGADPAAIARVVNKGWGANTADAIREVWINGLLSSPKTHMVNIMSNSLVALNSVIERQVAGGIRAMTGGEGVEMIEGAASTFGFINSVRDAFRLSAKALKTGETTWTFNKVELPRTHALSAEAYQMSKETALGRTLDFVGTATRVPTALLGAEDEFFKTIGYRMELYAQAARTAVQEGKSGYELGRRVAEIVQNPPEHIMINSADAALYNTFTNEVGSFGSKLIGLRNANPWLTFILPFVRTPVNIARYAFERTPFAPLVAQWRADIAAGGARADLALARMSTGTMIMLTMMDLADKGLITGSGMRGGKDTPIYEAQQRQGWQPYSFKVGDTWLSYNRADPFGMTIGFAASIAEAVRKGEISKDEVDEWQEVMGMAVASVAQVVVNKTYLEGVASFIEMMSEPKRNVKKWINDFTASMIPFTSLSNTVKNAQDPIMREVETPMDAVQARIAKLSENLPPRRDLWGQPISNESGLGRVYDALSPVQGKESKDSPIDREMVRLNHGVERIDKQTTFDGVQANMRFYPKVYDDYTRLAGNDLKHPAWGKGAHDFLNDVVSGKSPMSAAYNIMSDESRKSFIQSTIQQYRQLAQQQILSDPKHGAFAAEIQRLKEIHQGSRMPVLSGG